MITIMFFFDVTSLPINTHFFPQKFHGFFWGGVGAVSKNHVKPQWGRGGQNLQKKHVVCVPSLLKFRVYDIKYGDVR